MSSLPRTSSTPWLAAAMKAISSEYSTRPSRFTSAAPASAERTWWLKTPAEMVLHSWLSRAVVLASEQRAVGITGFHGPPGGAWLRDFAPDGVELGYTIFPGDRRRGYAAEAARALIAWAAQEHGVASFVLSIAPGNDASIRLAAKLGFAPVGEWVHPERGRELVYRADQ